MKRSDPQRQLLYAWERRFKWFDGRAKRREEWDRWYRMYERAGGGEVKFDAIKAMTIPGCQKLVNKMRVFAGMGGFDPTIVRPGRGNTAWGSRYRISLPVWAREPAVIAHETAHSLQSDHCNGWHNAEFVSIYIELVGHFLKQDTIKLRANAQASGLEVAPRPLWARLTSIPIIRVARVKASRPVDPVTGRYTKWEM